MAPNNRDSLNLSTNVPAAPVAPPNGSAGSSAVGGNQVNPSFLPTFNMAMQINTPHFTGSNVSDFLERIESLYDDYQLDTTNRARRIIDFCDIDTRDYIKEVPEWQDRNWAGLKKVLLEDFRKDDVYQKTASMLYLEQWVGLKRENDPRGLLTYARQYKQKTRKLVEEGKLSTYTRCYWFLKGMPTSVRKKLMRKLEVDLDHPDARTFDRLYHGLEDFARADRSQEENFPDERDEEEIGELVRFKNQPRETKRSIIETAQEVPVRSNEPPQMASSPVPDKRIDDLITQFSALQLLIKGGPHVQAQSASVHSVVTTKQDARVNHQYAQGGYQERPMESGWGPEYGSGYAQGGLNAVQGDMNLYGRRYPNAGGLRSDQCGYCHEVGHYQRSCPSLAEDLNHQKCHWTLDGKIGYGRGFPGSQPARFFAGSSRRSQVQTYWENNRPVPTQISEFKGAPQIMKRPTVEEVHNRQISLDDAGSDSDLDAEFDDLMVEREYAEDAAVAAARVEKAVPKCAAEKHGVLKGRVEKEKKLPGPKVLRPGNWVAPVAPEPTKASRGPRDEEVDVVDVVVTDSSGKRTVRPKPPRYVDLMKNEDAGAGQFLDKLLDTPTTVTLKEIITHSASLQKILFGKTVPIHDKAKVGSTEIVDIASTQGAAPASYKALTPKISVRINDAGPFNAMLDTGAEINVISMDLVDLAGIPMNPDARMSMVSSTGDRREFEGICENVEIKIGKTTVLAHLFVTSGIGTQFILGMPWFIQGQVDLAWKPNGLYGTIKDDSGAREVTARISNQISSLNQQSTPLN